MCCAYQSLKPVQNWKGYPASFSKAGRLKSRKPSGCQEWCQWLVICSLVPSSRQPAGANVSPATADTISEVVASQAVKMSTELPALQLCMHLT